VVQLHFFLTSVLHENEWLSNVILPRYFQWKNPPIHIGKEAGRAPEQVWMLENSEPRSVGFPSRSVVSIPTGLLTASVFRIQRLTPMTRNRLEGKFLKENTLLSSASVLSAILNLHSPGALIYTVELGYNDIRLCDTSFIASDVLWYQLVPHF